MQNSLHYHPGHPEVLQLFRAVAWDVLGDFKEDVEFELKLEG